MPTDPADQPSESRPTILVVDDTPANLDMLTSLLEQQEYDVLAAPSGDVALRAAASSRPELILLDVVMPGIDGYETCRRLKADPKTAEIPVLFTSALNEVGSIVQGFDAGGVDYISKPLQEREVLARVGAHLRISQLAAALQSRNAELERRTADLEAANEALRREADRRAKAEDALDTADSRLTALSRREAERWGVDGFIGRSATIRRILGEVQRVGNFGSVNVLITGESGTGKELIARAIHAGSPRASGPFIPVNCVAVPEDLAESMFFGHLRGSFTGATADRKGFFELANGGTLFLDEIGDMPAGLQAKLLRVLEDGRVTPIGASKERQVDVRVVAATNANLQRQMTAGSFRQDVYFRLAQYCVELPPLRQRRDDLPLLVEHFVRVLATEMRIDPAPSVEPAVLEALAAHEFPGNVRELKNLIERSLIECGGDTIRVEHLRFLPRAAQAPANGSHSDWAKSTTVAAGGDADARASSASKDKPAEDGRALLDLPLNLEEAEALLIQRAMAETGGNIAEAARRLGVNRTRIYRKLGQRG